ncbi:hypothetical protein [Streptomyces sp. NPDC003717]|uniref:hypothetical protein n=1 Tax=Streptomyces sp. NPDC003717 TaxID=3154276 RepID=UPI0033BEB8AD
MNRDPERSIFARKPRTRWRLAWLSVAGALVLVGVAGVLALQDYDGADSALPMGVLYLVAWAVCMPLLRPRHADGPD